MLANGFLREEALREALRRQQSSRKGRIGYWLREIGAVDEKQVAIALSLQWSCPVFSSPSSSSYLRCAGLIPFPLMKKIGMVPVHYNESARDLHVAFAWEVDHTVLYVIERVLKCRTHACIATESFVRRALGEIGDASWQDQVLFTRMNNLEMVARTIRNYATQLEVENANLASCGGFVWARLEGARKTDLLFFREELPADAAEIHDADLISPPQQHAAANRRLQAVPD
jgi:hypothetical protein